MYSIFNKNIFSNYPSVLMEIAIIVFTFLSFGILGFLDDFKKYFPGKKVNFWFEIKAQVYYSICIIFDHFVSTIF